MFQNLLALPQYQEKYSETPNNNPLGYVSSGDDYKKPSAFTPGGGIGGSYLIEKWQVEELELEHDLYLDVGSQSSTGSNGSTNSTALSIMS